MKCKEHTKTKYCQQWEVNTEKIEAFDGFDNISRRDIDNLVEYIFQSLLVQMVSI